MSRERERLKAAFKSKKWYSKVDNMTDAQVIAILKRLIRQGKA